MHQKSDDPKARGTVRLTSGSKLTDDFQGCFKYTEILLSWSSPKMSDEGSVVLFSATTLFILHLRVAVECGLTRAFTRRFRSTSTVNGYWYRSPLSINSPSLRHSRHFIHSGLESARDPEGPLTVTKKAAH